MAALEFRWLGPLEVLHSGAPVPLPPGLPSALLARLLVSANAVVPTDHLVDDLWRAAPPATAGTALRGYVSGLRRLLEPDRPPGVASEVLVTRRPGYLLAVDPKLCDGWRFETLLAEGGKAFDAGRMAEASRLCGQALGLWRGAVLAELADEPFVAAEAARLGELRLVAADRWADAELALGHHAELTGELEALVRLHPFRERLWAQLIIALYRSGRQADALGAYQRLRATLAEELGLDPSPPLRHLEAAVLRQDPDLAVPAGVAAPVVAVTEVRGERPAVFTERTAFVGREAELAELRSLMDQAAAGAGGLVIIGGEPGVGKSRLAEEVVAEARGRFRALTGHCYDSGRDVPYMPWVEMIETAMEGSSPEQLRQTMGDEGPELARLVPELRRALPDMPPPVELPPEQQRRYTFNSIRDFLSRISHTQPRLYILEDLHWADEPTLLLLEHVAERLATIPCLIIGTFRDPPLDVSPLLAGTLSRLVRVPRARLMSLERHSEPEVEGLLVALSGQTPPARLRTAVYGETAGNVFFVEEVFRHLAESGRLLDDQGHFREHADVDDLGVPSNVRLVTGQRLDRLSPATQQMLGVAAVAGRHVGFELLEAIAAMEGDALIDALDEAERAEVIFTEAAADEEEYWFAHELTRQTILARLPAARRRRHHLVVAGALERLAAGDPGAEAGTIAHHLTEAGSSAAKDVLFRHLVLAGQRALDSAAVGDALRHLRRAASLAGHAGPAEQAEMYFALGMAERSAGNVGDAFAPWRRANEIYEQLGEAEALGRVCLAAAYNLAWAALFADASELAERGLAALGERRSGTRSQLLALSGTFMVGGGDYRQGMDRLDEALALAGDLEDEVALGYGLLWKTVAHVLNMEMRSAVDAAERGAESLRSAGELWALAGILGFLAECNINIGRLDEAAKVAKEVVPLAERLGNPGATWHSVMVEGALTYCRTGDLDALESIALREIALCEDTGMAWASWGWSWLSLVSALRGQLDLAISHGAQAEALAAPTSMRGLEWAAHFESRAAAGQRDEALAMLSRARADLPRPGEPAGWGPWMMLVSAVEGLLMLGERAEAAALHPLVCQCMEDTGVVVAYPNDCKLLERVAGMAAAAGQDWAAAEAHFRAAVAQAAELPHFPEQAHARRWYAAMLAERDGPGDAAEAERLAAEAEALYGRLGIKPSPLS